LLGLRFYELVRLSVVGTVPGLRLIPGRNQARPFTIVGPDREKRLVGVDQSGAILGTRGCRFQAPAGGQKCFANCLRRQLGPLLDH